MRECLSRAEEALPAGQDSRASWAEVVGCCREAGARVAPRRRGDGDPALAAWGVVVVVAAALPPSAVDPAQVLQGAAVGLWVPIASAAGAADPLGRKRSEVGAGVLPRACSLMVAEGDPSRDGLGAAEAPQSVATVLAVVRSWDAELVGGLSAPSSQCQRRPRR